MLRTQLLPWLLFALATLAATALAVATSGSPALGLLPLLLLATPLLAIDAVARRRSGLPARPSGGAWIVAVAVVAAGALVAAGHPDSLPGFVPILASCAALPLLVRGEGKHTACARPLARSKGVSS